MEFNNANPTTGRQNHLKIDDNQMLIAKAKAETAEYVKLLASRLKEQRDRRSESLASKRIAMAKAEAADYQMFLASRLEEQRQRRIEILAEKWDRLCNH